MAASEVIGITGIALALPSTAVAIRDWRSRHPKPAISPSTSAPFTTTQRQPPPPAATQPRSYTLTAPLSIPRRLLSGLVDGYGSVLLSVGLATAASGDSTATTEAYDIALTLSLLLAFAGLVVWHASTGRSPGKHLVGGRLQRSSDPSLGISLWRAAARIVLTLIPLGFWMVLGSERRTAYDRITDTSVVRV